MISRNKHPATKRCKSHVAKINFHLTSPVLILPCNAIYKPIIEGNSYHGESGIHQEFNQTVYRWKHQ
jgi:hypothetical protein